MDPRENEPFDREPWRKLLGVERGGPVREIERRILDEARRAVAPHVTRWLLPASLAASVLIAVLIVQWQLAGSATPAHVTESDVISVPAPAAADEPASDAMIKLPAERRDESPARLPIVTSPRIDTPRFEARSSPNAAAPESTTPSASAITVTGQRKQEPESERERSLDSKFAADAAAIAPSPQTPAPAQDESSGALGGNLFSKESGARQRMPEEWYAEIEALRTAGKSREADEEQARLETAYPGWLEQHNRQKP